MKSCSELTSNKFSPKRYQSEPQRLQAKPRGSVSSQNSQWLPGPVPQAGTRARLFPARFQHCLSVSEPSTLSETCRQLGPGRSADTGAVTRRSPAQPAQEHGGPERPPALQYFSHKCRHRNRFVETPWQREALLCARDPRPQLHSTREASVLPPEKPGQALPRPVLAAGRQSFPPSGRQARREQVREAPDPPTPRSPGPRPSSARSLFPVSRSCSFSRRRRTISRAASFSFLWSRGTDDTCGGCGFWSLVPMGPWSAGTCEQSHRQRARKPSPPGGRGAGWPPQSPHPWGTSLQDETEEGPASLGNEMGTPHAGGHLFHEWGERRPQTVETRPASGLLRPPPSLYLSSKDNEEPAGTHTRPPGLTRAAYAPG